MNTKRIIFIVGLLIAAGCGAAYLFFPQSDNTVAYLTEPIRRGTITKQVTANGEAAAVNLVSVGAQVSGQIKKLHVKLGQQVKKGDLIAEIDSVPQINQLNIDKAKLATYQAQLKAKKISLKIAQTQYNRVKSLRRQDAASKEDLENSENTLALTEAEAAQLESQIVQTQIAVDTDVTNLSYTRIVSPLDGIIVSVPVDEGQTVNANQTTPTIVQVADLNVMEIRIEISEGDISLVKPGIPITYTVLSTPDKVYGATLTSIDPGLTGLTNGSYKTTTASASAGSGASAVYFYGKAQIDNSDGHLRIGMTAQSVMNVATAENALLAPIISVKSGDGGKFVFILNAQGKPERRPVEIGINDGVHTEIISGLAEGDNVITAKVTQSDLEAELNSRMRRR